MITFDSTKRWLTLVLCLFLFFVGNGKTQDKNEAFAHPQVYPYVVECQDVDIKCYEVGPEGYKVIRSQSEYESIFRSGGSFTSACDSYKPPAIDFDKYSLIAIKCATGGCDPPEYEMNLVKLSESIYKLNFHVTQIGECYPIHRIRIKCLVPKIDDGAEVEYRYHETWNKD